MKLLPFLCFSTYSTFTLSAHLARPDASDARGTIYATDIAPDSGRLAEGACYQESKSYGYDKGYC